MRQSDLEMYIKELNDKMSDIISRSKVTNDETRLLLEKLFLNLTKYNVNRLSELKETVELSIRNYEHQKNKIRIITALADVSRKDIPSFFPIAEISEIISDSNRSETESMIGVFFKCSYKRFVEITDSATFDREYTAILNTGNESCTTSCRITANNFFVKKEALLNKIAYQYGIDTPLVFSPFSRRFALVVFNDPNIKISDKDRISIPELDKEIDAFTNQKSLYWNVKASFRSVPEIKADINDFIISKMVSDEADFITNEYIIPGKQYLHKDAYKCKDNEFILFNGIGHSRLGISRQPSEERLYILYDTKSKIEPSAKVTITSPDEIELSKLYRYFENTYSELMFKKSRLRTVADIQYALSAFRNNTYGVIIDENISFNYETSDFLDDYNDEYRYYRYISPSSAKDEPERTVPQRKSISCCVVFRGDYSFTEDFARYVLSFLNEYYPEISWIGRCR